MEIWRAALGPPPAWRALPKIVSSICAGSTPARCIAAVAATTPMSAADIPASVPPNLPMGVRTAETMKTSCMKILQLISVTRISRPFFRRAFAAGGQSGRCDKLGDMEVIYGIHAVEEALNARGRSFEYVAVARDRHDAKVQKVIDACRAAGIAVRFEGREHLNRLAKTASHQGVVAIAAQKKYNDLDEILQHKRGQHTFVVVLDGVEDPHNLGAILRTADAAGVDGVVLPERRAVGVTATVVKASAGASEHVPVAKGTNIARTVEELKS